MYKHEVWGLLKLFLIVGTIALTAGLVGLAGSAPAFDEHSFGVWLRRCLIAEAIGLGVWNCLPYLLQSGGVFWFRNGVRGGPLDIEPEGRDGPFPKMYAQLRQLEFEPLGIYWEKTWGLTGDIFAVLVHQHAACVAFVLDLRLECHVKFFTLFETNEGLQTCNYFTETKDGESFEWHQPPLSDLREVFVRHQDNVAEKLAKGQVRRQVATLQAVAAMRKVYWGKLHAEEVEVESANGCFMVLLLVLFGVPGLVALGCWLSGQSLMWAVLLLLVMDILLLCVDGWAGRG